MWVGTGGEGAKHWMNCLAELRNRGVADVMIVACDGLKGAARVDNRDLATGHGSPVCGPPGPRLATLRLQGPLGADHTPHPDPPSPDSTTPPAATAPPTTSPSPT